jgi:hypothetical protein
MVSSYLKLIEIETEDENNEAEVAASCCLKAIQKIVKLATKNASLYEKVEAVIHFVNLAFGTNFENVFLLKSR